MHEVSEEVAKMCKTDYASTRGLIHGEDEYESLADLQQKYEVAHQIEHIHSFGQVVEIPHVQDLIAIRQEACTDSADERLRDLYTGTQEPYLYNNPFTFRNWHASAEVIRGTVWAALCFPNGQRLREFYMDAIRSACHEYEMGHNTAEAIQDSTPELQAKWWKIGKMVLESVEKQWMTWYGEEDVRTFSRFLLYVLHVWIMSKPNRIFSEVDDSKEEPDLEEDDNLDVSGDSYGGGECHCHNAV